MKKTLTIGLVLLCFIFFISCNSKKENVDNENNDKFFLNSKNIELILGEEYKLYVTEYNLIDKEIIWASSDNQIVEVNNEGLCVANNIGKAIITAYIDKDTTCKTNINVQTGNMVPVLKTECNTDNDIVLNKTDSFNISSYVVFNNINYYDIEIEYIVSDGKIIKIENDTILPLEIGETDIVVKTSWKNLDDTFLSKKIKIIVK